MGIPSGFKSDAEMLSTLEMVAEGVEAGVGRFSACASGSVSINYNDVRRLCALARTALADSAPKMALHVFTFTPPMCCHCNRVIDFKIGQQGHGQGGTGEDFRWWHYPTCPPVEQSEGRSS